MKVLGRLALAAVLVGALVYVGIVAYFYIRQRDEQYDRGGKMYELAETALERAELVAIPTESGAKLAGWYEPPERGKPVILYYRGKTHSFSREYERFEAFEADGYGFLGFDYRGFGGSPGEISQANVLADALAAFDWVAAKGFPVVIWGRSLGSGPATYVASEREAKALLLESPFTSAAAVAEEGYGFLPIRLIMLDQYPVDQWITKVEEPVFVAHGADDTAIRVSHGERVYALAPNPRGIWIEPGGDHDNLWEHGIWEKAKGFFAAAMMG